MFQELEHCTMKYQDIMQYCKEQHQIKLTKHNEQTQICYENFAYCVKAFFHPICYQKFIKN
jgi:hypothetical protein